MNPSVKVYPSSSLLSSSDRFSNQSKANMPSSSISNSINVSSPVKGALWSQHKLLKTSTLYEGTSEDQALQEYRDYIRRNFHKLECEKFVPEQKQPDDVKKIKDLRCQCWETLGNHEAVWNRAYRAKFPQHKDRIIPPELKALLKRPNDPIPEKMPQVAWDKDTCLVKDSTNAYGKINFNQAVIGGSKPAKYLRMTEKDSMDKLLHVMVHYWRILEPEPPHLVISVVGGAKNFRLDGRNRDIFQNGLIKAAKTTSAWLITSGFNMGVMKAVGGAVRNGQTFAWDKDRMAHRLRCIGIAPWGYVENRTLLCSPDQQGCFPATYSSSSSIKHDQSVSISPDHTHFVFVDNGMRNHYAGVANFRAAFERKISLPTQGAEECGLGTPVVIMVIEGGTDTITAVATSIEQGIPVVVCAGTGRAADVLAYAFSHTLNTRSGERFMPRKHAEGLAKRLFLAYGKNWEGESGQAELERLQSLTLRCCQKEDLMTIFYMQQNEDLDLAILSALVKAKGRASLEQRQNQLRLALTLDRCDIVHQEIFREDIFWPKGSLDEIMTEAVLQDRVGFVALLVQQGVVMTEYLTPTRLHQLYNAIPPFCHLRKLLERSSKSEKFSLSDVQKLLDQLLDLFVDQHYNLPTQTSSFDKGGLLEKGFQRPFRELFLWAVLMNRQELAKLCWEMGEDTIATAVIATRLYLSLSKRVPSHEHLLKQQYLTNKVEFEQLATSVLAECHGVDPDKAMMLVEKRSPSWCNMTGLQMAAAANDQVLLSSSPCQNSINLTWKRGLLSSWRKIACALVCPILIWPLIEVESDKEVGVFRKAFLFYKAPITKFAANSVMYLLFLCTYSYMILFDFKETVSVTELICIIWIFTFLVDEIHCLLTFPTPTVVGKFRDWYGFLNRIDLLNLILVFIGFFLKLHPPYLQHAKHIYSLTAVGFYLRIMKLYKANSFLGPKLYMIVRMTEELLLFVSILVVFLLAYGVSSQSLLWPSRAPYWGVFRDIVYYPYWQIYGELFLEEIQSDEECYARYPNSSLASVYQLIPCRTYSFLVPFLLAAYLLIGNVLLLNLLIAIFSHVFDEVQKNTLEIWKYQVYFLVMEYDVRTFLVPPFSILEHVYRLLKYLARRTCCQKSLPKDPFSRKHFQYLQLFEKEMMANYLRSRKADETNSVDFKFNKIQQRVDEITKLIEDEIIADHQHLDWLRESQLIPESMETADSNKDKTHWPTTEDVAAQGTNEKDEDDGKMTLEDVAEETVKERRKEKKRKKKKKHKKNRSMVLEEGDIAYAVPDLNVLKSAAHSKPRPRLRQRFSNLSESNFLPDDLDDFYPRPLRRQFSSDYFAQHYMEDSACSGEEMDLSDMIPIKSVRSNVTDDRT